MSAVSGGGWRWTPGPWRVSLPAQFGRHIDADWAITDGAAYICIGPQWDDAHAEESVANAHLIAQAPSLFVALETALNWIEDSIARNAPDSAQDAPPLAWSREILRRATGAATTDGENP